MNSVIKTIEAKFLDGRLRSRDDHPAQSLTDDERIIYADYLDSIGHEKGAESFRNFTAPVESRKKGKKVKSNLIEIELFALDGSLAGKLEVSPITYLVVTVDGRTFAQGTGKNKKRFTQTAAKLNVDKNDGRIFLWE